MQTRSKNKWQILEEIDPVECERVWQEELYLNRLKTRPVSKFEALGIFKDDLLLTIKVLKRFNEMNDTWNRIEKDLEVFNGDLDVNRARGVRVEDYLNFIGWKHNRGRCVTPLIQGAKNPTGMRFKDNYYTCFTSGQSGDIISLVRKVQNLTFKESIKFLNSIL